MKRKIKIQYGAELYEIERNVSIDGTYYVVSLNGSKKVTRNLEEPFYVSKLPRGAKKVTQ